MSDSDEADDQEAALTSRMWAEPEPGPSRRAAPSGQGYCGYCRVLYGNLDQHLSSRRHLDAVHSSSRGSGAAATTSGGRSRLTLLERFLQDVLLHHPHRYHDNRPSHADLPAVSAPPPPRAELDELHCSDDSRSLGTREHPPSSERSANQQPDDDHDGLSQSGEGGGVQERLSPPTETAHAQATPPHSQATPPGHQATPPVHRKAHRKTNRRKTSDSSGSSRRRGDAVDRTIEEVIQTRCHDVADDTESFHFSLPVTMETQSEEWDSPVQVVLQRPVMAPGGGGGRSLDPLTGAQVRLDDQQLYSHRLHATLLGGERREGGVATAANADTDDDLPESFRGKSREQLEREDEEKVEELVRQFRRERFVCYFDSESLARYGRRSHRKKRRGADQGEEPHAAVLPLLDHDDHESAYERRRRRRRRGRGFRMASRCQVVKVSHATQTVRLVVPSVRQAAPEATPPGAAAAANQSTAERTPKTQPWRRLPASYCDIITPLQPRTSLVYLLCSPSGPAPSPSGHAPSPADGAASRRSRKKRRPLDLQGLKVKYKRLPVRFYDPGANRILKAPPRGHAPSPPPPCVRQLFRSLSPDLNSHRAPGEGPKDAARGRGQRGRGARRERTRPLATRKRTRAQATPPQATPPPRREGLRRHAPAGPAPTPPHAAGVRRGRGRRGRGRTNNM